MCPRRGATTLADNLNYPNKASTIYSRKEDAVRRKGKGRWLPKDQLWLSSVEVLNLSFWLLLCESKMLLTNQCISIDPDLSNITDRQTQ